jgi:hypothetical protein
VTRIPAATFTNDEKTAQILVGTMQEFILAIGSRRSQQRELSTNLRFFLSRLFLPLDLNPFVF